MPETIEKLKEEFDAMNANELSGVDLKTFISYLMLCDPTITQAKIAKILDITPVALSRNLNAESSDFKCKKDWSEKLLSAFSHIDIRKAYDNWNNLLHLVNHLENRQDYLALADLMDRHLDSHGSGYCFNPKSYSISPAHLLFERNTEKWVFFIQHQYGSQYPHNLWPYPRNAELQTARHYSIICQSNRAYTNYTKPHFLPNNLAVWQKNFQTISVLLISKDLDTIESETILFDSEKGIDFPEIGQTQ